MTTVAPDWSATADEIHCPLCDYNLRGLTQPLCPECGYTFTWPDLLDPKLRRHRYLFEHQDRRRVRSFFKTITRNFRPGRFWKELHPSQPVKTRRLVVYWLICSLVAFLPALAVMIATSDALRPGPGSTPVAYFWSRYYGAPAPTPAWWDFVQYLLLNNNEGLVFAATAATLYPLLCGLTLLLFHQSMSKARVKPGHSMRVAIYSGDVVFWYGLWLIALAMAFGILKPNPFNNDYCPALIAAGAVAVLLITSLRMWTAYRCYVRFPHALTTVAATQLIVLLVILGFMPHSVFVALYNYFR